MTAPLETVYAVSPRGRSAEIDETLTMAPPPRDAEGKRFYAEPARVVARVAELQRMGFHGVALNATAVFQAGARSVDAMVDALANLHDRLRAALR